LRIQKEGKYERIFALHNKIANLEKIAKYLKSDRRTPYGMGIYRHYPELDES
jgi:glutathione S-transferase